MNTVQTLRSVFAREFSFFLAVPAYLWQLLFFYAPLILVIGASCMPFTFDNYTALWDVGYLLILLRSLVLATINALLCVACAYPVAYCLAFFIRRWKTQLIFFLMLPFWMSFLVQIYAWFFVLEKHGLVNSLLLKIGIITEPIALLNTPFAIYLVMLYCYLPFAVMPIYSILEKFDKRLFEASADLGATQWQTFSRVTLPLSLSGIRTAFFLVYIPSFGEFVIPTLLGGGKQMYVGSLISHQFLLARNFSAGAAFTCTAGCLLVITSACWYVVFGRLSKVTGRAH
jgi:spermidine/putrescine transport system permease protein